MPSSRRNQITRNDSIIVAAVAAVSGVVAAFAGCEPTGAAVPDAILTFALAAFVTWLGASSPWWSLVVAGGVAGVVAAFSGPAVLVVVSLLAAAAGAAIGYRRLNQPVARAAIAGAVVQVALRLEWDPFFLSSALVAAAIVVLIAVTGWSRRQGFVRRRVAWSLLAVAAAASLATAMFGVAAAQVRSPATDGYHAMLNALELLQDGDLPGARVELAEASEGLGEAGDSLSGPLSQPARLVPVVAQNRNIASGLMTEAAAAADAASAALETVDLERLRIVDGKVDIPALQLLEPPLAELEATVLDLQDILDDTDSNWLVGPLASRLDNAREKADQVAVQAVASHAAAQVGAGMLGADEPRRYLIAFTNPAESRGQSGLMGNWSELTIDDGEIELTQSGRTAELESGIDDSPPFSLDMPEEYFVHYGGYRAGSATEPVGRKYWGNAFITPDTPSVGEALSQMYETTTGRAVDGVIIMDPTAIAGLLQVTGPIDVEGIEQRLSADNAVQFLTLDQYEFAENEREDFLEAVTDATVDTLLGSTLPPPQQLGRALGPAATEGHLSAWATRPEEQRLLELVGMDAGMPKLALVPNSDALAVTSTNGNGNKIDTFLERTITYRPVVDQGAGIVEADLEIALTNTAPTSGRNDYVIGNIVDLPVGTNLTLVEVWSALTVNEVAVDGEPFRFGPVRELGWSIMPMQLEIPPGETVTVTAQLSGAIESGDYELIIRPQPLPRPDLYAIEATTSDGDKIFEFDGEILRRSVLSSEGITAWRPADHPAR